MSAHEALGGRGFVGGLLAAAADWLIEPAQPAEREPLPRLGARPVVAVIGLSARCGTTTIARALGAQIAGREPGGACVVTCAETAGAPTLALPAAGRLARRMSPLVGSRIRACGRLCLVQAPDRAALADITRHLAPLVLDVDERAEASAAAALADHVVLAASPATEPALAALLAESLARVGPDPVIALNRAGREAGRWTGRGAVELPNSRLGAQLALSGREPRGALAPAVARLAGRMSVRQ